jgi:hypothetical protein
LNIELFQPFAKDGLDTFITMTSTLEQNTIKIVRHLSLHSCDHCKNILIRGPKDETAQKFQYNEVATAASEGCSLFRSQLEKASAGQLVNKPILELQISPQFDEESKLMNVEFTWLPEDADAVIGEPEFNTFASKGILERWLLGVASDLDR